MPLNDKCASCTCPERKGNRCRIHKEKIRSNDRAYNDLFAVFNADGTPNDAMCDKYNPLTPRIDGTQRTLIEDKAVAFVLKLTIRVFGDKRCVSAFHPDGFKKGYATDAKRGRPPKPMKPGEEEALKTRKARLKPFIESTFSLTLGECTFTGKPTSGQWMCTSSSRHCSNVGRDHKSAGTRIRVSYLYQYSTPIVVGCWYWLCCLRCSRCGLYTSGAVPGIVVLPNRVARAVTLVFIDCSGSMPLYI